MSDNFKFENFSAISKYFNKLNDERGLLYFKDRLEEASRGFLYPQFYVIREVVEVASKVKDLNKTNPELLENITAINNALKIVLPTVKEFYMTHVDDNYTIKHGTNYMRGIVEADNVIEGLIVKGQKNFPELIKETDELYSEITGFFDEYSSNALMQPKKRI